MTTTTSTHRALAEIERALLCRHFGHDPADGVCRDCRETTTDPSLDGPQTAPLLRFGWNRRGR